MPRIPSKWREKPLPTPEVADAEVHARFGRRPTDEPTEAEQALAVVAPQTLDANGLARPWEPMPNEPAAEYVAFRRWLLSGTETPKHTIARRWAWHQRKIAWDAAGVSGELATPEALVAEQNRFVQMGLLWLNSEISKHIVLSVTNPQPGASVTETLRAGKDLIMLIRLLGGLSTENLSVRGTVSAENYDNLTDEQMEQLIQLRALTKGNTNGSV